MSSSSLSIILGMGTGRCGTHSLVALLNSQENAFFTHEQPPRLPWNKAAHGSFIRERLERFKRTRSQPFIGDVASFYLPYAEEAIAIEPGIRIICLERPREEVVQSFCRWLDKVHPLPTNHWARRPASGWYHEPVWTRLFPQYDVQDREEGIRQYWEDYHRAAVALAKRFPQHVRIFPMASLNEEAALKDLLTFAGIPAHRQVLSLQSKARESEEPVHPKRLALANAGPDAPGRCIVLVPYHGHIHPACEDQLRELEKRGYTIWRNGSFAAIDQGRNQMATDALRAGFEELLWIDSDIVFHPDAVEQLRAHQLPIACGIYAQKGRRAFAGNFMDDTQTVQFGQQGGLIELKHMGAGFFHTRREVYQAMQEKIPLALCNEIFQQPTIPFFQPMTVPGQDGHLYLAEDYAFCQRARDLGYRIMADTRIRLQHIGSYAYMWEDAGGTPPRYANYTFHIES